MDIRKIMLSRLKCVLPDAMGEVASGGQLIGGYVILSLARPFAFSSVCPCVFSLIRRVASTVATCASRHDAFPRVVLERALRFVSKSDFGVCFPLCCLTSVSENTVRVVRS